MSLLNCSKCKFQNFQAVVTRAETLTKKCKLESDLLDAWINLIMVRVLTKSEASGKQLLIQKRFKKPVTPTVPSTFCFHLQKKIGKSINYYSLKPES